MTRLLSLAAVLLGTLTGVARLDAADAKPAAKPVPVADAADRFKLPEGFRATLFAGEPDVVQPIAMTFDDRGRMWVVECLSYPKWRGDGKGSDRVTILEDTDGDGKHDKKTVFLENGSNLSGIVLGHGGVWLCSLPNLIFIPVKDGEDTPAGPAEVVLDGWNLKDTKHNVFNSLNWGPDGWLYGCNGIQARSKVGKPGTPEKDRVYLDCGVWRYHPTRKTFESYASGTTNPFGLDWDEHGQMFITNCVIDHLWHVVPGGRYQRMYGQDRNANTYELMRSASDHKHWAGGNWTDSRGSTSGVKPEHSDAGGGHAHTGCCIYLGDNFPAEYRNSVFMCNIHGNRLNRDTLHRTAGGYVGKHAPDFAFANDPWFRGISIIYGPDGGLYVSDWTDTGECHNYNVADTTNGRIYKITFGTPKPWKGDVSKLSDAELVKLQSHKNEWFVRKARRVLHERAIAGKLEKGTAAALREILDKNREPIAMLRAMWALHAIGEFSGADASVAIRSEVETLQANAISLGLDNPAVDNDTLKQIQGLANSKSAIVRRVLAGESHRLPEESRIEVLDRLTEKPADPDTVLMIWSAFGPVISDEWVAKLAERPNGKLTEFAVRWRVTRPNALPDAFAPTIAAAVNAKSPAGKAAVLRGLIDGLAGTSLKQPPTADWEKSYAALAGCEAAEVRDLADDLALIFRDAKALDGMRSRARNQSADAAARRAAIAKLVSRKTPEFAPTLRDLLADPAVRGAAVRGLASYPDAESAAAILKAYPGFSAEEKADAIQTLGSRPTFALALLDAIEKGTVPKADVTAFSARQILALNNKDVTAKLATAWGTVRPAAETRVAQAAKWKKLLTADALKSADASNGRAVFAKNCAACHKLFGEGGDVGPELTGSQRGSLDYVLENVLDPSAVVAGEYRMTTFALADGRTLTGIVKRETPQAIVVRTLNEEVTVSKGDVDSRKQTPLSIMPDGLLDALKEADVRDLVAYLAAPSQVPLPK